MIDQQPLDAARVRPEQVGPHLLDVPRDRLGRESFGGNPTRTFTYTYDDANRLTRAEDPSSVYIYGYDDASQVTSVDTNGTPGMPRVLLTYTYDGLHNRIGLKDNLGSGGIISYSYNQ